ncbi:MAG: hypothetical protein ACK56I_21120 [bacterium]
MSIVGVAPVSLTLVIMPCSQIFIDFMTRTIILSLVTRNAGDNYSPAMTMTPAIIADVVVTGDETVGQISICLHPSNIGATTVNTDKENNGQFEIHKSCANSDPNLCILILLFIDVNQS